MHFWINPQWSCQHFSQPQKPIKLKMGCATPKASLNPQVLEAGENSHLDRKMSNPEESLSCSEKKIEIWLQNSVLKGFIPKSLRPGALCIPAPSCHGHWAQLPDELPFFYPFSEARKSFCRMKYPERAAGLAAFVTQLLNWSSSTWHWAGGNIQQDLLLRWGMVLWGGNLVG